MIKKNIKASFSIGRIFHEFQKSKHLLFWIRPPFLPCGGHNILNEDVVKMKRSLVFGIVLTAGLLFISAPLVSAETVALWLCDEGGGKKLKDSSGNGHHGTLEGKAGWTEGKFGKALELHGKPDRVVVPGSEKLTGPTAMTVELWLKVPHKLSPHSPISKGERGPGHWELLTVSNNGWFSVYISDLGSFTAVGGEGVVTDDEWHHCAVIWDGKSITLYVDGKVVGEWKEKLEGKQIIADDQDVYIGNEITNDTWHTGLIDEIRISDTALDVAELGFDKSLVPVGRAVDKEGKLATSWGRIRTEYKR